MKLNTLPYVPVLLGVAVGAIVFFVLSPIFILVALESEYVIFIQIKLILYLAVCGFTAGYAALAFARGGEYKVKWIICTICALVPWILFRLIVRNMEIPVRHLQQTGWFMMALQSIACFGGCLLGALMALYNKKK